MSEKFTAEIWIGGKLKVDLAPEFCDVICGQEVSLDWDAGPFVPQTIDQLLTAIKDRDGAAVLFFCDGRADWGEFNELEAWLYDHGLPYTRRTGSSDCYDGAIEEFRPGHPLMSLMTNSSGRPVANIEPLQRVWYLLKEAQQTLAKGGNVTKLVAEAIDLLASELPTELPRLEPFQIVP